MKRYRIQMIALAAIALFILVSQVSAYVYDGQHWASRNISYDKHTLNSSWQTAVWNGASRWNNVTPANFNWAQTDSAADIDDVYLGAIDGSGNTLATTTVYSVAGIIWQINMKFDTGENWYTGTGTPGSNQFDAYSVAAHEFGHGLRLGHTNLSCSGSESSRPTMCPSYSPGKTYGRSLHSDDSGGINHIYP